ncbi:hypothetical protein ACFLZ2_00705 [Candidatus Margulisiibacteriota bacterium]
MKRSAALIVILMILSAPALSQFKASERSIYTVISSTAYTAEKKGLYFGSEGIAFGLSDHTQTTIWGFLGYGSEQNVSIGVGLGFKQSLVQEKDGIPAISFDVNYRTIVSPDQNPTLPDLLQPYNVGTFNNAYSFGLSLSKQLTDKVFFHSAVKLYDYNIPPNIKFDSHLISFSIENRMNDWVRDYAEVNYDMVNEVLNMGIKFAVAPTDTLRFSLGYMTGASNSGLTASQFIFGAAIQF